MTDSTKETLKWLFKQSPFLVAFFVMLWVLAFTFPAALDRHSANTKSSILLILEHCDKNHTDVLREIDDLKRELRK